MVVDTLPVLNETPELCFARPARLFRRTRLACTSLMSSFVVVCRVQLGSEELDLFCRSWALAYLRHRGLRSMPKHLVLEFGGIAVLEVPGPNLALALLAQTEVVLSVQAVLDLSHHFVSL